MSYSQHTVTVTTSAGETLACESGRLQLDDSWAPWAQATLVVKTPTNTAALDPRTGATVDVTLIARTAPGINLTTDLSAKFVGTGKTTAAISAAWGGTGRTGAYVSTLPERTAWNAPYLDPSSLRIRLCVRRATRRTDGTTELELASAEALLQDKLGYSLNPGGYVIRRAASLRELLGLVFDELTVSTPNTFQLVFGDADVAIPFGTESNAPTEQWTRQLPGQSFWDFLTPYLQKGNLRLWADVNGLFQLTGRDTLSGAPAVVLASQLTEASAEIDRDSELWADEVILEYLPNPTDATIPNVLSDSVLRPSKTLHLQVDAITPVSPGPPNLDALTAQLVHPILQRLLRRGLVVPVKQVSDYNVVPTRQATITTPVSPTATGVVQGVVFDVETSEMTVTTRNLEG